MTTEELAALQALLAKMTPGEWQWRYDALGTDYPQWSIQPGILIADGTDGTPGGDMIDKANAAGIVALVNAAPALIASAARVAELEAEVSRLRDAMRMLDEAYCNDDYSTSEGKAKGRAALMAARAAMAVTRKIDADALRAEALQQEIAGRCADAQGMEAAADWLQQRANDVKETGRGHGND